MEARKTKKINKALILGTNILDIVLHDRGTLNPPDFDVH